jgi:2,3,4,5-tetrahydropyridine-2-carboxylate N-succinyltransferase
MSSSLQALIDAAWEDRAKFSPADAPADVRAGVASVIEDLNAGRLGVGPRVGVGRGSVPQSVKKYVQL